MENNTAKTFPFLKVLYKNVLLIVLIVVLCAMLALGYSVMNKKTTVTVSQSVILRTSVSSKNGTSQSTNASHGKIYINEIRDIITNPKALAKINEYYVETYGEEAGQISAKAINITSRHSSLIFNISYTDSDEKVAFNKLRAIYIVANDQLIKEDIQADPGSRLILTDGVDEIYSVVKTSNIASNVVWGAVIGCVIAVGIAFLMELLDNTVKDREEFEELTDTSVLSLIDKQ